MKSEWEIIEASGQSMGMKQLEAQLNRMGEDGWFFEFQVKDRPWIAFSRQKEAEEELPIQRPPLLLTDAVKERALHDGERGYAPDH